MLNALKSVALDYNYNYSSSPTTTTTTTKTTTTTVSYGHPAPWLVGGGMLVAAVILLLMLATVWKIFTKAKQAGWKSLIPFYNTYTMLKIVGRPGWWLVLFFLPVINFVVGIIVYIDLAKSFGKSVGYGLGLTFLPIIFFPMLAFGKSTYSGPSVK